MKGALFCLEKWNFPHLDYVRNLYKQKYSLCKIQGQSLGKLDVLERISGAASF